MASEKIPEFLVRIDYEIPPMRGIMPVYFDDNEERSDEHYRQALLAIHSTAIIRGITRRVKPETGGKGGCS